MNICVIVKSDNVYSKLGSIFHDYDVLRNVSHFMDLLEFVRSEEISIAIIDESIHWKERAEELLREYKIKCVVFTGNFNELEAKVRSQLAGAYIETQREVEQPAVINTVIEDSKEHFNAVEESVIDSKEVTFKSTNDVTLHKTEEQLDELKREKNEPAPKHIEIIKEVPRFIDRPVIKEVPVEKIVEKIKEVTVEKVVEREVTKREIVEVKPNFDDIDLDFELPNILSKPAIEESSMLETQTVSNYDTTFIGIVSAENEVDLGSIVFMVATSLAELGYKPLIIADAQEEITLLERSIFKDKLNDDHADVFESEGVSYMRQGAVWDYSELLSGEFTHVIFWFGNITEIKENDFENWTRTHYPLLVLRGAKWNVSKMTDIFDDLSEATLRRIKLLLEKKQSEVLKELKSYYPEVSHYLIPYHPDPFSPDKFALQFVGQLFNLRKKRKFNAKLWFIFIFGLLVSAMFIWAGTLVPEVGVR
ncbi:hypothetical protein BK126_26315 [Paenibacillus sp. FSL H7-0326]|uniref:hypothetical protein n=1 Tax=Paenibacillus sp. FSL H7-0326 TaxID=1921144 RepID=UPI00096F2112|nr:hypothetical protein [Paenibacillus sp. FSL H7-0326]OMC63710.1 hypothetical protein BK126_26315 [Paenibacillus sp. FSL H7-0326]